MASKTTQLLTALGLSASEAAVYEVGLAQGAAAASELAARSGLKRPTAYHAIASLMAKGLAAKKGSGGRAEFSMLAPSALRRLVNRQMEEVRERAAAADALVPLLAAATNAGADGAKVDVRQFDGLPAVRAAIDEALYCKSRKWDIIAPPRNFFSEHAAVGRAFMATRRERGIVSRSLWERDAARAKPNALDLRDRQPRYLPAALNGKFASTLVLFDDAALIVSSAKRPAAVLIRARELVGVLRVLFEGLWGAGEKA